MLLKLGKTLCRKYRNRIGAILDYEEGKKKVLCYSRAVNKYNYPGCPFNKEGLPEIPWMGKKVGDVCEKDQEVLR